MKNWFKMMGILFLLSFATSANATTDAVAQMRVDVATVLQILHNDNTQNSKEVLAEVEKYARPRFDLERLTALAVGKAWKSATAEQKQKLIQAYSDMLVKSYSRVMLLYKNANITVADNPVVLNNGKSLKIRTDVSNVSNGKPELVEVDYTVYHSGNVWRIYDVQVEGQSLVMAYRSQFEEIIAQSGIDGLIATLNKKTGE